MMTEEGKKRKETGVSAKSKTKKTKAIAVEDGLKDQSYESSQIDDNKENDNEINPKGALTNYL
jgi:hypothetical protein